MSFPPWDPLGLRRDAPLLDAWIRDTERAGSRSWFQIPGHKNRTDLVGAVVHGDIPVLPGNHSDRISPALVRDAEVRAAELWGCKHCRFGVNGSTGSNHAALTAVLSDGDKVVVSRTLHKSALVGLVYSGAIPIWVRPEIGEASGLPEGLTVETVAEALRQHPDAKAVFVGEPSYVGTLSDVPALAALAHQHKIPLLVDAAWSAHFGFHDSLPRHAIAQGADVVITSAHKCLPSYSQAAMVLVRSEEFVDVQRFDKMFDATQSTSSSGRILASIDAARALLQRHGSELIGPVIQATAAAKLRLKEAGVHVLDGSSMDPLKLVILLASSGVDGTLVEKDLFEAGIDVELASRDMIIPMITMADTANHISALVDALLKGINRHKTVPRSVAVASAFSVEPDVVVSPRRAFFSVSETVAVDDAIGRVCAELACPYPPGVPVLSPGERITRATMDTLLAARDSGVLIRYNADSTLATIKVLPESAFLDPASAPLRNK